MRTAEDSGMRMTRQSEEGKNRKEDQEAEAEKERVLYGLKGGVETEMDVGNLSPWSAPTSETHPHFLL